MAFGKRKFSLLFLDIVGKPLEQSVQLCEHSNFRIGGSADYFFKATSALDFVKTIRLARENSLPYYIIGEGCNLLFDDMGFRGLIIKNCAIGIKRIGKGKIEVFSGTSLYDLLQFCVDKGLGGLEFLAGIPGTVGGAVFGNAGAFGQDIGKFLKEAVLLNEKGEEIKVKREYFEFGYRQSLLKKKHEVLLKVVFGLQEEEGERIKAKIEENLEKRKKKHPPLDIACAGSYFKNPILPKGKKVPAAYLLDQVGAKNLEIGGARVYSAHANFIINQEGASAKDVLCLASELKRRVKEKFDVELEEEVIFLPAESSMP